MKSKDEIIKKMEYYVMAEREARRRFVTALVNGARLKIISYTDIIANDGIAIFQCCEVGDDTNKPPVEIHCEVTIFGFDVCECTVCGKKWAVLTDFEMENFDAEDS